MITLIVARAKNGAIGKDNTIPWHAPEDLKFFKKETQGGALIMGRNTWDSLPVRPLPGRLNLVVSATMPAGEGVARSCDEALQSAKAAGHHRIYAIGGAAIYRHFIAIADRLLITEVDLTIEEADTFFPAFAPQDWALIDSRELTGEPACRVDEYLRRGPKG